MDDMARERTSAFCSKDGCTRLRTKTHSWCQECQNEHQQNYHRTKQMQAEGAGFAKGIEAMRLTLALEFDRLGLVTVTCDEVAAVIRRAPRPQLKGS